MSDSDLTVLILREIRDEIRTTNQRLDTTIQRLDNTIERLDVNNRRLGLVICYVQHHQDAVIDDLRVRVTRLEAKQG